MNKIVPNRLIAPDILSSALFVKKYPGSRVLEMVSEHNNNVYTQMLFNDIKSKLNIYKSNKSISAIVIKSNDPKNFSCGNLLLIFIVYFYKNILIFFI